MMLHRLLCLLAVLLPAECLMAAGEMSLDPDLGFHDCHIGTGAAKLSAQCTTLELALDPQSAAAGTLTLSIARVPARRQSARQDAFTLLAGGPGQSAIESYPAVAFAFRHVQRDRDVILIDQRGTGDSQRLSCPTPEDSLGVEFEDDVQSIRESSRECLDSLEQDPRHFTTSVAVQDLEQVRQALGISQWNLYGISYGTRVALHYLRRHPDKVRTLILDAVVPPTRPLGPDIAQLAQRSLDMILQRCADDKGCGEAFGDLDEPVQALLQSLQESPRTIRYEDIASGQIRTMRFTRQHLALTLRLLSYSSQTAALLPSMLHEAIVNDNLAPMARQAELQSRSLGQSLATGMHAAVICTEDAPYMQPDTTAVIDSYMGDKVVPSLLASCSGWPTGIIDEDFHQAVSSDVPTLVLSGGADPVTPPAYGDEVASTLSRSLHLINPEQGHMQAPFGCMPSLMAQFVDSGDIEALDTRCLERIRPLPFFVDANGPLP